MRRLASVGAAVVAGQLGVNGRDERSNSVAAGLGDLSLLHLLPLTPVFKPSLVVLAEIKVDVEPPVHGLDPVVFQRVEFRDGNAADFGPGAVLEGVVVEELAAEEQRNGEVAPHLSLGCLVRALVLHSIDSLGEIVHAKKNGGAGKSRRSENLGDELAEGRRDWSIGSNNSGGHLGNVFSHHVDLIIEDGTHASGHDDGDD